MKTLLKWHLHCNGIFHAISYASRQLVTHEKNYLPFLLEMQSAIWGMEYFQEHLRGKRFILFTDHKPLEALSHIHTKTLNRLQLAMLNFDFEIQYKKGTCSATNQRVNFNLFGTIKSSNNKNNYIL